MSFDLKVFGNKLFKCRDQLQLELQEVASKTGIDPKRLHNLEKGLVEPSGDEVLILSDAFKQDYQYFISNEQKSAIEQVDILYRKFGSAISKQDRWAIQEFIFLCECEEFILKSIGFTRSNFKFVPKGKYFKQHGYDAAVQLRQFLGYKEDHIIDDIYSHVRKIGFHVFRRRLENSSISGLFINHPYAGRCILVNYNEDVFRQNFTVSHEMAHAIFDYEEFVNISFDKENEMDLREVRANAFASEFLVPYSILEKFKRLTITEDIIYNTALKLKINPQVLLIALRRDNILSAIDAGKFKGIKIPRVQKEDSELLNIPPKIADAKRKLLEHGLSSFYVRNCHVAYSQGTISANRMAEMLLTTDTQLPDLLNLFSLKLSYDY